MVIIAHVVFGLAAVVAVVGWVIVIKEAFGELD